MAAAASDRSFQAWHPKLENHMSTTEQLPVAESARWQMLRAGIQNVWEYDNQRFVFHKGRLLLRGQNESGKTKALEVLLPFLLDASLHAHRLDPFGANARSMHWNLINESNPKTTVSIGYVWLELGRLNSGTAEYWTVGAGLKARRASTQVDDWYFATPKRVDEALHLYDANKVPLTRPNLEAALGTDGTVFGSSAAYRRALNEKLFGLGPDQYGALVDALLQLRRPQLSKGLDPEELSRILSASLPPLDPNVIGTLAEGFDRLERHRSDREDCQATLGAVRTFLDVYRQYAGTIAKGRALEVTRADSSFHAARAKLKETEAARDAALRALDDLNAAIESLETEDVSVGEKLRVLRSSEEYLAVSKLKDAERQAAAWASSAKNATAAHRQSRARAARAREGLLSAEKLAEQDSANLAREKREATAAADASSMSAAHDAVVAALDQGRPEAAESTLQTALRLREETIAGLRVLVQRVDDATRALDIATSRAAQAEQRVRGATESLDAAASAERRARSQFLEGVETWLANCRELKVDASIVTDIAAEGMRSSIEANAATAREALDEALRVSSVALDSCALQLDNVRSDHRNVLEEKHRPPQPPVWRTPRKTDRAGAPLYLLCEFTPGLESGARAGIEGALEASGLLDAWLTPTGELLDAHTSDVIIVPRERVSGPSLANVLRAVPSTNVPAEHIVAVLESIGLGESSSPAWVAPTGAFALGPLRGQHLKQDVVFIGAAEREQARLKRLAELEARISLLENELTARTQDVATVRERRTTLDAELRAFPDLEPLRNRVADVRARTTELEAARETHSDELQRVRRADTLRGEAAQALDTRASQEGLRGWIDRLNELLGRTATWRVTAQTLVKTFDKAARSSDHVTQRKSELADIEGEVETRAAAARDVQRQATEAQAHCDVLRDSLGKTPDDLDATLHEAEKRQTEVRQELKVRRDELAKAQNGVGAVNNALAEAATRVQESEGARREADLRFRTAEGRGLLAIVGVEGPGPAASWSYTDVLLTARRVDEVTGKTDPSDNARDKAWNKVNDKHQELTRSVKLDLRVFASQLEGVTLYEATLNARRLTLLQVESELANDLEARHRLLAEEERKLFESFLTGEAHEHLREQLREAHTLVKKMNNHLAAHPTSSGMLMKLQWEVAEDAAPGTKQAVTLLFKSGELMSDADRSALHNFLRLRLDEARAGGAVARSMQDQLLSVLDYRAWHRFQVQCRSGSEPWKPLTRKVHATGSGGQKAVLLHLPLFAAAAAFYDSAREGAPRFILLDEAFAGIDRQTRGELMGLLADFDLDFVMTSFEEWGFYPQVDGLSTYHLAREKGMVGVYSEWFIWDGHEAVPMPA
ncbi:MAG: TIGR02680 family protein [Archangium sp.]|nr:TIGR02680 family protein [Archangium sp.]